MDWHHHCHLGQYRKRKVFNFLMINWILGLLFGLRRDEPVQLTLKKRGVDECDLQMAKRWLRRTVSEEEMEMKHTWGWGPLAWQGKRRARALVLGSHSSQTLVAAKSVLPDWSQTTVFRGVRSEIMPLRLPVTASKLSTAEPQKALRSWGQKKMTSR